MDITQAIVLGAIQGITEFLPVSSSGHLIFLPSLFGWEDQGILFDVVVHLGTLTAVLWYFKARLITLAKAAFSTNKQQQADRRLAWYIVLSIIPVGIVGLFLGTNARSASIIGWSFIIWGIVLYLADKYASKQKTTKDLGTINTWDVVWISFSQILALIPGTSRSGITMTTGLFRKLDKKAAAEFSFLISIPVIAAAGALQILEVASEGIAIATLTPLLIGFIISSLSALLAMHALIRCITRWGYTPFVLYRVVVGIGILLFLT